MSKRSCRYGILFRRGFIAAGFLLALYWTPLEAQKRIYISPDDHTDYLWTADEATYRQAFIEMIDYYLHLADSTDSEPASYQSRWSCDGSHWMWTYEQNKSAVDFNRLIDRIRSGHISVPLTALVSCYGGTPAEAVLRGMYYPGRIERRYDLRFSMAVAMENQTLPYGLGSLWAGSGARYSWRGICGCATRVPSAGDREHDMYWWVGPDSSRILMKWNSLFGNASLGGYAEARDPSAAVDLASGYCNGSQYPYSVIGAFGAGWDDLKTFTTSFMDVARSKSNAGQQVFVSNEEDFFLDFDSTYGSSLPEVSATFGNEWELYCASMAEVSARVKRSVEKLRTAEALATLVSLESPGFMNGRDVARDSAFLALGLYWEHDWTGDGPVSRSARAAWQRRMAGAVEGYVNTLQDDAAAALGNLIRTSGTHQRFYVFNALGWSRSDFADFPFSRPDTVHVVDVATNAETPSQIILIDGQQYLRILATSVPPAGYRVYEIRNGSGSSFGNAATVASGTIENPVYRLTVAPRGAITGFVDKSHGGREFAATVGGRAINDFGSGTGTLQVENAGPVSVTLLATSSSPLQHTSRITLYRDSRRIDIRNDINQNFSAVTTVAFSLNLASPDIWHEEVGAIIRAKLQSQGGHYSDRAINSRYDWLTMNHFADMSGGGVGVTVSNADCYYMKVGNSTVGSLDAATPQMSVLVGGQVDGAGLGIQNQDGDSHFLQRFALMTHDAFDQGASMRMSMEHQNPLLAAAVVGGLTYSDTSYSLLSLSDSNAILWALKPSEEGISEGVIARIWNVSSASMTVGLTTSRPILQARRTTHIETDLGVDPVVAGQLSLTFQPRQIQTHRIFVGTQTTNAPPYSSITSPLSGASFLEPADITIAAAASDSDGTVRSVEFYSDALLLAVDSTSPYVYTMNGVSAGNYNIRVRAVDNQGSFSAFDTATINVIACAGGIALAPLLIAPDDGVVGIVLNPRLSWNRSDCALRFHVQVGTDSAFTSVFVEDSLCADTSVKISGLSRSTLYYWRIRGYNETDSGAWSAIRRFLTGSAVTRSFMVDERWNLVSLPVEPVNSIVSDLFTDAGSPAFLFTGAGGYAAEETLRSGRGYWLKFPSGGLVEMTGEAILLDSVDVQAGWNLVGSISDGIAVLDIGTIPEEMTTSELYGYSSGYHVVDSLFPGKGYWIRASVPGKLFLSVLPRGSGSARIRIVPTTEPPPSPPVPETPASQSEAAGEFKLDRSYPNPFNPVAALSYYLPVQSQVTVQIFNMLGQAVAMPVNSIQEAGFHMASFDGSSLSNGVYLCRMDAVSTTAPVRAYSETQKMVLLK